MTGHADILLTGAGGQVGWAVVGQASAAGLSVADFDRAALDITDSIAVDTAIGDVAPRVVVNAAAYTAVDRAESDAEAAFAVNRDGAANLAYACAAQSVPLIHLSTDYVFDGSKATPYTEEDAVAPLGVYGASKWAGEEAVRTAETDAVILRTAWVYGVHGHNFVKTILRLARKRAELRVVDDQFGTPTYAGDLADAILTLAHRLCTDGAPPHGFGTFHATNAGATTWCGFAQAIVDAAIPPDDRPAVTVITTAEYPTPARRPANSVLDCGKLARVYDLTLRPWQAALGAMLNDGQAAREATS